MDTTQIVFFTIFSLLYDQPLYNVVLGNFYQSIAGDEDNGVASINNSLGPDCVMIDCEKNFRNQNVNCCTRCLIICVGLQE